MDLNSNPHQSHGDSYKYHSCIIKHMLNTYFRVTPHLHMHCIHNLYNDVQQCWKWKPVRTTVPWLHSNVVVFFPSLFWNSIKLVIQWAPAGCMGGDFEAINGDSKGKHSAKCQLWWLRCHNIISGRETQITKINNLIISYSNHAGSRSGSYCSFISLVCWCIPINKPEQADALKIQ